MAMPSTPSYMNSSNNSEPPASVTITPLFQPQISSTVKPAGCVTPIFTTAAGLPPGGLKFEDIKLNTFRHTIHHQQPIIKSENSEVESSASSFAGDAACIKCEFCEYRCSKKDRLTR